MPSFETYLITPTIADPAAFRPALAAALAALRPASLLLRFDDGDERALINRVKALAPLAQEAGVAVLVEAAPQVAVRGGADGVHVATALAVGPAREVLTAGRIVGAGALRSRHDAMEAGEAGADYIMFGEPRPDGSLMTLSALVDRASWWAEVFETPCVAYAAGAEAVAALAWTRAEFIALGPWCFDDPLGARDIVEQARAGVGARA